MYSYGLVLNAYIMFYLLPYDIFCHELIFHYKKVMIYKVFFWKAIYGFKYHGGLLYEPFKLMYFMISMHDLLALHVLGSKYIVPT